MTPPPPLPRPLAIVIVLALAAPAAGQVVDFEEFAKPAERPQDQLPTPEEIIGRHIEATGGHDAYARVRNRRLVGTLRQGDAPPQRLVIQQSAPNNRHVELIRPGGGSQLYIVNADESWTFDGDLVVAAGGDQRTQEIRRAAFRPLLHWRETYPLAKTLGVEDVGGRAAYKLQLTADDCHKVTLYFDRKTGRAFRRVEEIAYAGTTIDADMTIEKRRTVDGIDIPTRFRRSLLFDGRRIVQEYEIETIEHNVEMPPELFETPPELRP